MRLFARKYNPTRDGRQAIYILSFYLQSPPDFKLDGLY
ncbi:MAG: hypothetical protein JWQ57_4353 [Mucilaginibacter sp.]|nr:hypothetical protein [Mucilaginibacter sp.]